VQDIVIEQNPWWQDRSKIDNDPVIQKFNLAKHKYFFPYIDRIELKPEFVYILRGPRQVGKTTLIKLLIKKILTTNTPEVVFYLDFQQAGINKPRKIFDILKSYIDMIGNKQNYIFLDEVTYTKNWSDGIESAVNFGLLKNSLVFCTGSNALDLYHGSTRLPGRRGKILANDLSLQPLSFREYTSLLFPEVYAKIRLMTFENIMDVENIYKELFPYDEIIRKAFEKYIITGGFLPVINSVSEKTIPDYIYKLYSDAIIGDILRIGKREQYFREIINFIINVLGNPFDYRDISRETDVGKHTTAREYIEDCEQLFMLNIFYKMQSYGQNKPSFRSGKKVYFSDPIYLYSLFSYCRGLGFNESSIRSYFQDDMKKGIIVEGIVGTHLKRKFPNNIFYWKNSKEIDFVITGSGIPIEVKYKNKVSISGLRYLSKYAKEKVFVLSKNDFYSENKILIIPVYYFLLFI